VGKANPPCTKKPKGMFAMPGGPKKNDIWKLAYTRYEGTIRTFSHNELWRLEDSSWDFEDLQQELAVTLLDCISKYNPAKGATFNSYFQQACKNRIVTIARRAMALSRKGDVTSIEEMGLKAILDDTSRDSYATQQLMEKLGSHLINITYPSAEEEYLALETIKEMLYAS